MRSPTFHPYWTTTLFVVATLLQLHPTLGTSDSTNLDEPFTKSFARLNHAPCVALYHREGRIGCGTESRNVQKGELVYFDGSLPNSPNGKPYVVVMEDYFLTAQSIDTLLANKGGLLQGILVLNSTNDDSGNKHEYTYRSPDSTTPQGYKTPSANINYGYYSYQWNAKGEDLLNYDLFGVPMAYVPDSDVSDSLRNEALSDASASSNSPNDPVIVAEFDYYMGPDGITSAECLGWKDKASNEWSPKCLPLGGSSVWATAGSPNVGQKSSNGGRDLGEEQQEERDLSGKRQVVMLATGIDSTSMFHDISPGANSAASGILALLMAAKLIGANIDDKTLDNLNKRIAFGFFQGESYGFIGSRTFLRDLSYPGFQCAGSLVPNVARLGDKAEYACLHPLRPSLKFANLGTIVGMLAVDQVGRAVGDGVLYVHADQNYDKYGAFLAKILYNTGTSGITVAASSTQRSNSYGYPYPPTPLTSLLSLSGGSVGGAVLSGYDYAFSNKAPYHSHLDSSSIQGVNYDMIAHTATILARAAVAAAYDDGSYDYSTASSYASNLIPELDSKDETFLELADCLFYNGECNLLKQYAAVEAVNDRIRTGLNLGIGQSLGNPPNYYVGVYNGLYGQPFVQVGDNIYGGYDGQDYGQKTSDAIGMQPRVVEAAIQGMLDDFLGRGGGMSDSDKVQCKKISDCSEVDYCSSYGDTATCTGGGVCVCKRSHYHVALDEALLPAKNMPTGYFEANPNDKGVSAMYAEPYWNPNVGVRVYRDSGSLPGFFTLVAGAAVAGISLFAALVLKVGLKKEKLY